MSSERSSKATYDSHVSILSSELAAWLLEASHRPETYCSLANIFASGDTKLYDPPSTKLALDSIFKRLSSVLCDGRDKSTVIWALASLLGEKRMLLMEARLWSTEKLPGQDTLPSDSRASSVSGHSIGPSFTQFQTESYTASRPSLSSLAPDENGVDSNRTSATPYSFGSRGKFDGKNTAESKSREAKGRSEAETSKDEAKKAEHEGPEHFCRNTTFSQGYWEAMHPISNRAYEVTDG
ncbi:MAG: hypothetical protein ALECFALPRED_008202 [Alectoria fallacina]|uniref:Uncharacterized protein n=1 Tax=Alectoria fallacina TaxID=1903189 RepID=A0A8H3J2R7_9LECA|nr:MAG: hypothetical protein ALECFALPRED_008202 [Alectoria fallacina]